MKSKSLGARDGKIHRPRLFPLKIQVNILRKIPIKNMRLNRNILKIQINMRSSRYSLRLSRNSLKIPNNTIRSSSNNFLTSVASSSQSESFRLMGARLRWKRMNLVFFSIWWRWRGLLKTNQRCTRVWRYNTRNIKNIKLKKNSVMT